MYSSQKGFTLIELLVAIAIIGVLSTIAVTSLNGARTKAKWAIVNTNVDDFVDAVSIAQGEQNANLEEITGSTWTEERCCDNWGGECGNDLRNLPESDSCYQDWINALYVIEAATKGVVSDLSALARDPWGSPYLLDENEGEVTGRPYDPCTRDQIRSVGPDGRGYTADDSVYFLPYWKCAE